MASKKIEIYLHGYHLGTLSYDRQKNLYTYNSNLKEEEKFKAKHRAELFDYNLWGSENAQSSELPQLFEKEVKKIKIRKDIMDEIKVDADTHPFEILLKWGKLPQCEDFLVLVTKNNKKVEKTNA